MSKQDENGEWIEGSPPADIEDGFYWVRLSWGENREELATVRGGIRTSAGGKTAVVLARGSVMFGDDVEAYWTERVIPPKWNQ